MSHSVPAEVDEDIAQNVVVQPENDDPLQIKLLALNFDYLLYKISDHVNALSQDTYTAIHGQQGEFDELDLPVLDASMEHILKVLLPKLCELEANLMAIGQVSDIAKLFRERILTLEQSMKKQKRR
ncbi:hypothetical protein BABINDRAFT_168496 [Babjeviella inositovora NRRL Y-12698]|uniref:Biogenesis of lysosome-related organelles complex 1 subunit CNL1 n=1 Tax=Babjeviella inositovora NRRL Y-12698 TaxID=984486 RepID=A0A1E3QMK8_9ASCO|nr:uncharacterized protein BABINDRAFT_168496 [Babjeviella inositovora NRRL Y-12698]ODQ78322.1 hypothetical protein BABINDRAFT_168496 [Babjeviella inositovora NRRL Y-12698]